VLAAVVVIRPWRDDVAHCVDILLDHADVDLELHDRRFDEIHATEFDLRLLPIVMKEMESVAPTSRIGPSSSTRRRISPIGSASSRIGFAKSRGAPGSRMKSGTWTPKQGR
jgi:hypothetical protein